MARFPVAAGAYLRRLVEDLVAAKVRKLQGGRPSPGDLRALHRCHRWALQAINAMAGSRLSGAYRQAAGLSDQTVALAAYSQDWPRQYEALAETIRMALGRRLFEVHHIGSTSIPGLSAKPIVDCAVLMPAPVLRDDFPAIRAALESAGFTHRGRMGAGEYFSKDIDGRRVAAAQIHPEGSHEFATLLSFRDRLRSDPSFFARYRLVKETLAAAFPANRALYYWFKRHWIRDSLLPNDSAEAWGACFFESEHSSMLSLARRFSAAKPRA